MCHRGAKRVGGRQWSLVTLSLPRMQTTVDMMVSLTQLYDELSAITVCYFTLCLCCSVYFADLDGHVCAMRSERLDHAYPHSVCIASARAAPIVKGSPLVRERVT